MKHAMRLSQELSTKVSHRLSSTNNAEEIKKRVAAELVKGTEAGRSVLLSELLFTPQGHDLSTVIELIMDEYQDQYELIGLTLLCDDLTVLLGHLKSFPGKFSSVIDQVELFVLFLHDYVDVSYRSLIAVRKEARNLDPNQKNTSSLAEKLRPFTGWRKRAEDIYKQVTRFLAQAIQVQLENKNSTISSDSLVQYIETVANQAISQHQQTMLLNLERHHSIIMKSLYASGHTNGRKLMKSTSKVAGLHS